jgi:predicted nucleotidyltransferase
MRIVGIIAEYNPFHAGHAFQIKRAKELAGADACAVIMSGPFVQRGEPAVFSREARAEAALLGGADLVLSLPAVFASAAAPDFARAGVALADALGLDALCFGSESGDLSALSRTADILAEEPEAYGATLREKMRLGMTFPAARESALAELFPGQAGEFHELLASPNNLLGIEYLTAAKRIGSSLSFCTVRREDGGYHGPASAEKIRRLIRESAGDRPFARRESVVPGDRLPDIPEKDLVPESTLPAYEGEIPLFPDDFSALLQYAVTREKHPETIDGLGHGLGLRLGGLPADLFTFGETVDALKTRNITRTAVSRGLTRLLIGIHKKEADEFRRGLVRPGGRMSCLYAEILGFRREMSCVLRELKSRSAVPLLTKKAEAAEILNPLAFALFQKEMDACRIYGICAAAKGGTYRNMWRTGPVILSREISS